MEVEVIQWENFYLFLNSFDSFQSIINPSFASFVTRKTCFFGTRVDTIKSRDHMIQSWGLK